jgi:hypothetical protein
MEEDFNPDPIKQERGLKMLIFDNSSDVLVAESENQIIGMITMQHLISKAEGGMVALIEDMVVKKE